MEGDCCLLLRGRRRMKGFDYMKTAIVTDSTAYLEESLRNAYNITLVPLSVTFGEQSYREELDITTEEFYEKLITELPKTSQPSTGMFVEEFERLKNEGYEAVVSIHLSSGISGTYQNAITAGSMVDGLEVYTYDSEISCMAQGFYVLEAAKMAMDGKDPEEIITRLDEMKPTANAYFVVDDLNHLQRGGRLNNAQAFIGSLLQIKPLLHFEEKKIVPFEKVRTAKKALARIYELFAAVAKEGKPMKASIIHSHRQQDFEALKAKIESEFPNVEVCEGYFGPVIGTHLGDRSIGLAWYVE